jgi:hypothetical protein
VTNAQDPADPATTPTLSVRHLDELDYLAKLRHWMRSDPWTPDGARLYFKNPVVSRSAVIIRDGHIESMPPLVGRPCFGIATAFLRYRDHVRYTQRRGLQPAGRCADCKAREACAFVVERRLRSSASLTAAWTEWLQADGPAAFGKANYGKSLARHRWHALYRELARHAFRSSNDAVSVAHYHEQQRAQLEKDRVRQARKRKAARRQGIVDTVDLDLLEAAASTRRLRFSLALLHPDTPRELARLPGASVAELLDVWLGREVMRLRKVKPSAPNIARWIVETGRSNKSKNHAALSTRVDKDLKRIDTFESLPWEGGVLLPPLDPKTELPAAGSNT